jgi:hypothetical protein
MSDWATENEDTSERKTVRDFLAFKPYITRTNLPALTKDQALRNNDATAQTSDKGTTADQKK